MPNSTESDAIGLAKRIRAAVEANPLKLDPELAHGMIKTTISFGMADSVRAGYDFKGWWQLQMAHYIAQKMVVETKW